MGSEIEKRGTILFGAPRGMSPKLASEIIDDGAIEDLMDVPQTTYKNKRRKELRRLLYNLIYARSLSRAYGQHIKVAVPLRLIHDNKREYHRVSYQCLKAVINELGGAGLIEVDYGERFINAPVKWHKRQVNRGALKNKMTELWATGQLRRRIDDYLEGTTDVGADVEMLVSEGGVALRDDDGNHVTNHQSQTGAKMKKSVRRVNKKVARRNLRLELPLTRFLSLTSPTSQQSTPQHSQLTSPISIQTSPPASHTPPDEKMRNEVLARCPQAWEWGYSMTPTHFTIDVPERALTYQRKFTRGRWDCGGRFYAPVQNIPSEWRKYMKIDGEPAVELDYDNLHIAMLYAKEGRRLQGDAYDITSPFDLGEEIDECLRKETNKSLTNEQKRYFRERQRKVVKMALNVLINAPNYQSAYEKLKNEGWTSKIGAPLPRRVFKPLVGALRDKHKAIEDYFHSDIGIRLQRQDSDMAYLVMKETGAIGIHDGFVIEASREAELRQAMKAAFKVYHKDYGDIGVTREFDPIGD